MNGHYINEKENPFDDSKGMIPQPIAAPRPGYAAPVSALMRPSPTATPEGRMPASPEMSEFSHGGGMPSTPHPLQPPMVPIAPVFARPSTATSRDVKFASSTPIMRGDSEDTVLPRRGNRGDDFWRRFSMVVKEDMATPAGQKQSMWLRKTQNGTTRMSRWVWVVGITLLIVIGGAIGLGWYVSHNNTGHATLKAIGGSADEKATSSSVIASASATAQGALASSTSLHVSPTNTVARRAADPVATPEALIAGMARSDGAHVHVVKMHQYNHRRSSPLNRTH